MPYFYGFCGGFHFTNRVSTHPNLELIPTHLELGAFSTPTAIGTPTFHLEHPPQVQTVVVGWNLKLTVLLWEFKFFHLKTPVCRS